MRAGDASYGGSYSWWSQTFTIDQWSNVYAAAAYVYDAEGKRVRKTTGGLSVDYVYDLAGTAITELSSAGAWNRGEVYAGGRHVATYASNTTYFDLGDWLGTERVRTTAAGVKCETVTSLAFGDGQTVTESCGDPSPLHFTGKQRDTESGLDNFGARYNSSSFGRFMTPDPLGGALVNPQSLNLYAYVVNNPISNTDPTGMYICKDSPQCSSDADTRFETARQNDLKSKDSDVVRAAQAYGDPGKDNGVNVSFADLSKSKTNERGSTVSTLGSDDKGNLRANSNVVIDSTASGDKLDAVVGHEGSHVADAQDFVKSISVDSKDNITMGQDKSVCIRAASVSRQRFGLEIRESN